jgi:glycosyltransferase involved in cell wall biosynthesis
MINDLVSIIMPVYNSEAYLLRSINSVLNQTYSKFELIIVNDGSTDNTEKIIRSISDSRVKAYTIKNGGPSKARNYGLQKASGEFVQFIDSDDYLENDAVEYLVERINKCDIVITSYKTVSKSEVNVVMIENEGYYSSEYIARNYLDLFKTQVIRHLWNKLYLKRIIDKNNLTFNEELRRGEGIVFNINYLKYVNNVYLSTKSIYNYYIDNQDSITSNYLPSFIKDTEIVFTNIKNFLKCYLTTDTYSNEMNHLYIDRMINYIGLLFKSQNKISHKIIIKEILSIVNNEMFRKAITSYVAPTWKANMLKILLKNKMSRLIFVYYYIKFKFSKI